MVSCFRASSAANVEELVAVFKIVCQKWWGKKKKKKKKKIHCQAQTFALAEAEQTGEPCLIVVRFAVILMEHGLELVDAGRELGDHRFLDSVWIVDAHVWGTAGR
jgi:hypothetical protein